MSNEKAKKERVYLQTMSFAKRLLNEGIITKEQYDSFDTKMQQKYEPTFSTLLVDISLDN